MASGRLSAATAQMDDLDMDMSPMIDLVFLLLIFFMVSSHLIVVQLDPEVKPPIAESAIPSENALGRIVVNIRKDGSVWDVNGIQLSSQDGSMDDVESYVREVRDTNQDNSYQSKLHVRADRDAQVKRIKQVVQAAANAEVIDVIFASFVSSAYE